MINWSKYFDKIYCILEVQNANKKELLEKQLQRIGILNSGIFEYHFRYNNNTDIAFYNYLQYHAKQKNHTDFCTNVNHFQVIQLAQYWQYKRILIIEDNIRFLKDLNKIEQILKNRPTDADLILYDKFTAEQNNFIDINNYYSKFTSLNSTACYELSNKGIDKLKDLLETNTQINIDEYFNNISLYLNDLNCYCSKINLAIQVNFHKEQYRYPTTLQSSNYNLNNKDTIVYCKFEDKQLTKQYSNYVFLTKNYKINLKDPITPTNVNIFITLPITKIVQSYPLLYSLTKYSQSKFNVYIMLDKQNIQQYDPLFKPFQNERMNIKLLDCKLLNSLLTETKQEDQNFNKINWATLLIPTLFSDLERILYLDYNSILTNKGIEWLYNINFNNNYLVGVKDPIYNFDAIKNSKLVQELNIFKNITNFYVQGGVLLFNIKKIVEDNKAEELKNLLSIDLTSENTFALKRSITFAESLKNTNIIKSFNFADQSYLNYFFANSILEVNDIFNNYNCNMYNSNTIFFKKQLEEEWKFENEQQLVLKTIILHFIYLKPQEKDYQQQPNYFKTKYQKQLEEKYNTIKQQTLKYIKNYYD